MKITTYLRTAAQLKGMIDEVKIKRRLLDQKILKNPKSEVSKDLSKLENDLQNVMFGFDILEECAVV